MKTAVIVVTVAVLVSGAGAASAPPDRRPPTTPTVDAASRTTDQRPVFTFGATDERTPRAKLGFRCSLDGARLHPCARIHRPAAALAIGAHSLRVRAVDLAGNLSRTTVFPFMVVGTWNAARDFEHAPRPANPGRDRYGNTAWSYRYSSLGRAHDPAAYELLPTFYSPSPNWESWHVRPDAQSASVSHIDGKMILHPAPSHLGHNAILAWRSPLTATVRLRAELVRVHFACPEANGVLWSLDQGNRTLRAGTLVDATAERFELTVTVVAGESLYVVVGDNGAYECDSTAVELDIKTT